MTITFLKFNNKGQLAWRPWAITNKRGQIVKRFRYRFAAEDFLDARAPGWRIAA